MRVLSTVSMKSTMGSYGVKASNTACNRDHFCVPVGDIRQVGRDTHGYADHIRIGTNRDQVMRQKKNH